jgi:hypothetical protein
LLAALLAAGGPVTAALPGTAGTLWLSGPAGLWVYEPRTYRLRAMPLPARAATRPGVMALA